MSSLRGNLFGIVLSFAVASLLPAADKKKSGAKEPEEKLESIVSVLNIDPTGRPDMSALDGTKMYIWCDDTGWHLRTNTKKRKKGKSAEKFGGVIQIEDGRVTGLQSIAGLEGKKQSGAKDLGWLSPERKTIRFEFRTAGRGEDGFDFQVSNSAKAIRFDLRIGGYDHPDQILLGAGRQRAPAGAFVLPVTGKKDDP